MNPYKDTFEEYLAFHENVVRNAERSSEKVSEPVTDSMSVEEFMKARNILPFDDFLKKMSERYGI